MADKVCFVIMPFGEKIEGQHSIDFDTIYELLIKPSVQDAGLKCIRCDEIGRPGLIHNEMITQIFEADVAVVDITTLNANVFYELGVRHALRPSVTVLIRKKTTQAPFNIQGLNAIEYDEDMKSVDAAKKKITAFIAAGLKSAKKDSLVHNVLDLRVGTASKPAPFSEAKFTVLGAPDKRISVFGGDIRRIRGIDVWVNSENTNMQMARFFDRSVSSMIRFLGAEKDEAGHVTKDVVAEALAEKMGTHTTVHPATVIATTPGDLARTHGARMLFHAAAVTGELGHGYTPIANIEDCITNALTKVDLTPDLASGPVSILFPLMGTGTAHGDLNAIVARLLQAAIDFLAENPESTVQRACFVAWSEEELLACQSFLDSCEAVVAAQ